MLSRAAAQCFRAWRTHGGGARLVHAFVGAVERAFVFAFVRA